MRPKLKVLIVDDNKMDRSIIKAILVSMRIKDFTEAENGSIAEGKIETASQMSEPFDLVILDWNMGPVNGLKVLKHLKSQIKLKACKVIIMTATADRDVVEDAIENNADDFIVKPVSPEILQDKITKLFGDLT